MSQIYPQNVADVTQNASKPWHHDFFRNSLKFTPKLSIFLKKFLMQNIKATRGNELLPNRLQFLNTQTISVAACEKAFENEPDVLHANNLTEVVCAYTEDAGICLGDLGKYIFPFYMDPMIN